MDKWLPMRHLELEYKGLYEDTGFQTTDTAVEFPDFQRFLEEKAPQYLHLGRETLGDSKQPITDPDFFEEGLDVTVIQHLRYLPAVNHSHAFF